MSLSLTFPLYYPAPAQRDELFFLACSSWVLGIGDPRIGGGIQYCVFSVSVVSYRSIWYLNDFFIFQCVMFYAYCMDCIDCIVVSIVSIVSGIVYCCIGNRVLLGKVGIFLLAATRVSDIVVITRGPLRRRGSTGHDIRFPISYG